jgi:hypothetical protein
MRLRTSLLTIALGVVVAVLALQVAGAGQSGLGVLDSSEAVTYFIEDGSGVAGYQPSDRELARMAFDAWSRETRGALRFTESITREGALVSVEWADASSGSFGLTHRTEVGGKAGAIVFVMPDVRQLGQPLSGRAEADPLLRETIVYLTCVHEIGHAVGMPHTRNFEDIMYSFGYGGDLVAYFSRYRDRLKSRSDIASYSGLSTGDIEFLRSLYAPSN